MVWHVYKYSPTAWIIAFCHLVASASSSTATTTATTSPTALTGQLSSLQSVLSAHHSLPSSMSPFSSVFVVSPTSDQSQGQLQDSENAVTALQQPEATRTLFSSSGSEALPTSTRPETALFRYGTTLRAIESKTTLVGESLESRESLPTTTSGFVSQ